MNRVRSSDSTVTDHPPLLFGNSSASAPEMAASSAPLVPSWRPGAAGQPFRRIARAGAWTNRQLDEQGRPPQVHSGAPTRTLRHNPDDAIDVRIADTFEHQGLADHVEAAAEQPLPGSRRK
jgi:hypothetical protein